MQLLLFHLFFPLLALWHFVVASLLSFLSTGAYVLVASFFVVFTHYKGEFPEGNEAANATLSVLLSHVYLSCSSV